jgi:N utilization substance protein A
MAALVVPGAPVSVLIDHGLTDKIVEMLMQAGVPTVESLGSMTPEELEAIEGIDPEIVESIQVAVNSYYGQFETSVGAPAAAGEASAEAPAESEMDAPAGEPEVDAAAPEASAPAAEEEPVDSSAQADVENESDTIKNRE